ncbi:hypothetical protein S245_070998 [Arachis hypogaea]
MLQWRSISAFFRIKLSGGSKILRMERLNLNQKGQRFFEFDVPESSTSLSHPQMTINERVCVITGNLNKNLVPKIIAYLQTQRRTMLRNDGTFLLKSHATWHFPTFISATRRLIPRLEVCFEVMQDSWGVCFLICSLRRVLKMKYCYIGSVNTHCK